MNPVSDSEGSQRKITNGMNPVSDPGLRILQWVKKRKMRFIQNLLNNLRKC